MRYSILNLGKRMSRLAKSRRTTKLQGNDGETCQARAGRNSVHPPNSARSRIHQPHLRATHFELAAHLGLVAREHFLFFQVLLGVQLVLDSNPRLHGRKPSGAGTHLVVFASMLKLDVPQLLALPGVQVRQSRLGYPSALLLKLRALELVLARRTTGLGAPDSAWKREKNDYPVNNSVRHNP